MKKSEKIEIETAWKLALVFQLPMYKWGLAHSCNCECGTHEQTADHIISA